MKILIFGASGSGTTTLGKELARRTDFIHLDADDYYWRKTEPPFQQKIPLVKRNETLKADFHNHENVIISGSMVSWGKEWKKLFQLAVFIRLNDKLRMQRLKQREIDRYGDRLNSEEEVRKISEAFLEWAGQYENPNFNGRSSKVHNDWIQQLECKVLRIDGGMELEDNAKQVLNEIKNLKAVPHQSQ